MLKADYIKYSLTFNFPARTSRGVLNEKDSWFIRLRFIDNPEITGIGECSIIPGLSQEDPDKIELKLDEICRSLNNGEEFNPHVPGFPSIRFGLEMALKDLNTGGKRILFTSVFTEGIKGIPINGLIWMGNKDHMLAQVKSKIEQGFSILKLKVGALEFDTELDIIRQIRNEYSWEDLEIRLDANGAWDPSEALKKLKVLSEYNIHSVEQPIKSGQIEEMARICEQSTIDIALDEEIIGIEDHDNKEKLIEAIKPAYVILKPSLIGGFGASVEWIRIAGKFNAGWWITSALESNIGLNAIAQWTMTLNTSMPQGLGTGTLYSNNIPSPLVVISDKLYHRSELVWDISNLLS